MFKLVKRKHLQELTINFVCFIQKAQYLPPKNCANFLDFCMDFQKDVSWNFEEKTPAKQNSKLTFISVSHSTIRAAKAERPPNTRK